MKLKIKHRIGCASNMNSHLDRPVKCDCGAETQAKVTARQIVELMESHKASYPKIPIVIIFDLEDWQALKAKYLREDENEKNRL